MILSSKNKKILIFSDVHQQIDKIQKIIKHEKADINVCLGDWMDSHVCDSIFDAEKTIKFIKDWILEPNNITCWGNHDLPHFYINKYTYCSGYEESKNILLDEILGDLKFPIRDKFKWYLWIDDYFCSHAGINGTHISQKFYISTDKPALEIKVNNKIEFSKWLDEQIDEAKTRLITGQNHWIYGAGRIRGGNQAKGGLTWQDFREFFPIEGLPMIFGHTYQKSGKVNTTYPNNYCIDTMLNEYLTITDGKLEIKKYSDI